MGVFVNVYLFITCLMELTVAGQKLKPIPCKIHAFCQNAISFELLYSGFVSCNNRVLYMQKKSTVYLSDCRDVFCLQGIRNENA